MTTITRPRWTKGRPRPAPAHIAHSLFWVCRRCDHRWPELSQVRAEQVAVAVDAGQPVRRPRCPRRSLPKVAA